jgi:hypothetical protein
MTCPLCVQWRCSVCKSADWPDCCDWTTEAEPYWPDGTVAVITQSEWCDRCAQAVADYEAEHKQGRY